MKFHWFAEATYPNLPPDFATRGSSWVDSSRADADPRKQGAALNGFLEMYEHAAHVGFDGLAVNEHHQTPVAMTPSPNLMAAALCRTTEKAAILVIGDSLALYNPPIRVAEEMAMLDVMSGGRLISGFVFGTPMDSAFCYGMPPSEIRPRFLEAHDLILKAWEEREPFAWNGQYSQLRYVNIWPEPIQKPRPPIWVPGTGSVETWEFVSEKDYCYGHLSFGGLHNAKPLVDDYWEYVDSIGGNMNPYRMAFTQLICLSETDAKAEEEYSEAVKYFYMGAGKVNPKFYAAHGYRTERSTRYEMERMKRTQNDEVVKRSASAQVEASQRGELTWKDYVEKGFVIAGSPATVTDQLRELIKQLNVGQIIATMHMGNLSVEQAKINNSLFAEKVQPHLKDLWSEWEDHWTPAGLAEIEAKKTTAEPEWEPALAR
jgi:alkanesulfonate monooxygenase SsuD/methylene tetrahydromethanopterin reductase-like flavin-dependent oxidoreductase (luciferase family)